MKNWLYNLNYYALQWFFIRLARVKRNNKQVGWTIIVRKPLEGWTK